MRTAAALLSALAFTTVAQAQPPKLADVLATNGIPSVSYAVIRGGKLAETRALGEQSAGVKATPSTLYNIASLTKPMSAEIVLRLASTGAFTLDEPMAPKFVDPDIAGDPRTQVLTPRMALTHQTGFPNWRSKEGLKFVRDPGGTYGYSGEGYQYVAHFAERATGRSFESLADAQLLKPDGLHSTSYVGRPWFSGRIAIPRDGKGATLEPHITDHFIAADLVYTTAADYARFMVDVLHDKGLTPAIAADRVRVQLSQTATECAGAKAATCPTDIGPGLGWQVLTFPGHTILMHTGRDPGVATFAYIDKTTGDGAVILTNGEHGDRAVVPLLSAIGAAPALLAYLSERMK